MRKLLIMALSLCAMNVCTLDAKENETVTTTASYDSQLLQPGEQAPDFTITNDQYPNGLAFSSLRGKYVVLEFWASWCPDCRKITPTMVALHNAYASDSVVFVGVSFDTNKETWQNYVKENKMDWIQYSELKKWKKETTIDTLYKVQWIPTMYVIGKDGKIIVGTVDENKVEAALKEIK